MEPIVACTPVCEYDAQWVDRYLAEVKRLCTPFAVFFDRCSSELKRRMQSHPLYIGCVEQDDQKVEYGEHFRSSLLPLVHGARLALVWDIDETWCAGARELMERMLEQPYDSYRVHWLNFWGDFDHVRMDNPSNPFRVKALRLDTGVSWWWHHPHVATPRGADARIGDATDVKCYNAGLMTPKLRQEHKARWDRVYGAHVGTNPYGYWDYILDEAKHPPEVARV